MNQFGDRCVAQHIHKIKIGLHTLERDPDGNETPTKYPKTTPIIVVIISLALSLDFFRTPLRTKQDNYLMQL